MVLNSNRTRNDGMNRPRAVNHINRLTHRKISVDKLMEDVRDDGCGAIVLFLGTVRNKSESGSVTEMYYESYVNMAERQISKIEEDVKKKWPITNISIVHRIGKLRIGDISVAVCVSSVHRTEAFSACRYAIDELKQVVPIWKKEKLADSRKVWAKGSEVATI